MFWGPTYPKCPKCPDCIHFSLSSGLQLIMFRNGLRTVGSERKGLMDRPAESCVSLERLSSVALVRLRKL